MLEQVRKAAKLWLCFFYDHFSEEGTSKMMFSFVCYL